MQFRINGKMQDVKTIYRTHPKRRGKAIWKLSVAGVAVKEDREVPVRLVYVANRNNPRDYLVLVTTDMSLREDEVIRNYGKRWGIKVFFKVCKSYLKLSKESRSLSYDALTAHVSIVFTRYMMLAVQERECVDDRSLGELFFMSIDELADITLRTSLTLILLEVVREIDHASRFGQEVYQEHIEPAARRQNCPRFREIIACLTVIVLANAMLQWCEV